MLVLVSYDVASTTPDGSKRLRHVAKHCTNYGLRVQYSVFECVVDISEFEALKHKILSVIDKDKDSIRFYILGNNWTNKVEHYGTKKSINVEEPIVL